MKEILESIRHKKQLHENDVITSSSGVRFSVREDPKDNQIFMKVYSPYDMTDYYWAVQTVRPGVIDIEDPDEDTIWSIYSPKNKKVSELEGWRSWTTVANAIDALNKKAGLKPRIDHT